MRLAEKQLRRDLVAFVEKMKQAGIELDMFGENNRMITVSRADLALIVRVMERGEGIE